MARSLSWPRCGGWGIGRLKAVHCGNAISVTTRSPTAGTLMHRSRFPLKEWSGPPTGPTHTPGMSATQLRRQMGRSIQLHGFCFSAFAGERLARTAVAFAAEWKLTKSSSVVGVRQKRQRSSALSTWYAFFGAVEVLVYTDKHGYYMERTGRLRLAKAERADEVPFVASCRRMWNWEPKLIPINEGIPKMP